MQSLKKEAKERVGKQKQKISVVFIGEPQRFPIE